MNLYAVNTIKKLLAARTISPKKQLGQNFLINPGVAQKMLEAAELSGSDTVVEIGPGVGTLTTELALKAKRVIAVEKDERLISVLKETLADFQNIEVINEDALAFPYTKYNLLSTEYKVVANLPYYITAPLIRLFLEELPAQPERMVCMVQKEVAQRICEKPPHMTLLSVAVQFFAESSIVGYVKKGSFWPSPNVDSAILRIIPKKEVLELEREQFFAVVRAGFLHPRRKLVSNIAEGLHMPKDAAAHILELAHISPERRAETLSVTDWITVAKILF